MNRRNFLSGVIASPILLGMNPVGYSLLGVPKNLPSSSSYEKEFPDMLANHLAGKLNGLAQHWDRERARILQPSQLEARNRFVRGKLLKMIGGLPERTPLNPKVVGGFDRKGYRVEKVMFQSRPDFWVTGNLYLPTFGKGPFPGIISPCGHYPLARMAQEFQCAYFDLVKSGFVVLAYDPVGQGERRYFWNPDTSTSEIISDPIFEHSLPGQLMLLLGENLTQFRIWDGMRSIDYLLTRPEVDSRRIGCTGHSGGGTLSLFITALDERVRCAVLNEGGAGQRWPLQIFPGKRIGPADVEQNIFPSAIYGIDQEDLRVAIAPRPQLVTIESYYPEFLESRQRVSARYGQMGVPEKFATAEAVDPHAWTMKLRLATTDWFCRWFYERPGPVRESDFETEPESNLYCTPKGSTRYSRLGETVFSLVRNKAMKLPPEPKPPTTLSEWEKFRRELLSRWLDLTHSGKNDNPLAARHLATTERKGYRIEKLQFLSEPGIYIPAWFFIPEVMGADHTAILYVDEAGKEAQGLEFGIQAGLALKGNLVLAVDVRGIGETEPPHDPELRSGAEFSHLFNVETALSYMAWFADQSLLGMRVLDVMRSADLALSRPEVDRRGVRVLGKGMGALWSLFAAALDSRIVSAICEGGLISYHALASADRYVHGANTFIRDVLLHFDLPQVAACIAGRNLALLSPVDPMGHPLEPAEAKKAYQWTTDAYSAAGTGGGFRILESPPYQRAADVYLSLFKG
jgi:cephalosporin-C deacetylase-like acetyl esterase